MSSDVPDDIRAILNAQTIQINTDQLKPLQVLPSITPKTAEPSIQKTMFDSSSMPSSPWTPTLNIERMGFAVLPKIGETSNNLKSDTSDDKPKTPLYLIPRANIEYNLDFDKIGDNEFLLSSSSSSSSTIILDEINDVVDLPTSFSSFADSSAVVFDKISFESIERIVWKCRIQLPELLTSDVNDVVISSMFPSRPSSSQEWREQARAQLMKKLTKILAQNRDIDVDRFKRSTEKQNINVDELKMLLQIYGFAEHVKELEQQIIDCFLTHEKLFCFSAFVGCLDQIQPLSSELNDSGVLSDFESQNETAA